MAKRATYGEVMASLEHRKDERDWRINIVSVSCRKNYFEFEELVKEGLYEGYEFPYFADPVAQKIIEKLTKK